MENKKSTLQNTPVVAAGSTGIELDSIPKHQHATPPKYLRYVQQPLKIPNNQQQSPMIHQQHMHPPYQPPQYNSNSPNIHTNPLHLHYNNQYIYQQNKLIQQQIYQTNPNQTTPPYSSAQNQISIIQTSPQPWVPVHSTVIYQNQPKTEAVATVTSPSSTTTTTTPVHNKCREVERKKSSGSHHQQLRSPSAKRPLDTPVTLQGWLHKQGSDGLMLWKKRWFVLTEYVLFYYKGSEEEKLLGSILLPSYRVSICGVDDKVNRKYAFKCEHTNMRTYVLAADSHELMMQWIRVLNLACILQTNIESESSLINTPATYNHEHSESNYSHQKQIQQTRHQQQQPHVRMPLHVHSSSNTTDFSNPSQDLSQYNQPLYANAPPKPRRLNDTGYSSPSPEMFDRYNEPKYVTLQTPPYVQRSMIKSNTNSVYSNHQDYNYPEYAQLPPQTYVVQNTERRTPDTYGRSKSHIANGRHPSDYEDIYSEQFMYKRPLSPLAYNKSISMATPQIQRSYTPMSVVTREARQPVQAIRKSPSTVPRPHSADFLEYELMHRQNNSMNLNPQPTRPKSSLDINRNTAGGDNYFYSEERYAEKMRKSAQYLSKMPSKYTTEHQHHDNTFPMMRSNTQPLHYANTPIEYASVRKELQQRTRCRSVLSEGSISKELDMDPSYKDSLSMHQEDHAYPYDMREYDPFTRSASARLANIEQRLQGDGRASMNKEGERKREESMKRLLEWKQRMLQSPLNRKMNQTVIAKAYAKAEYYKRNNSYASHMDARLGIGHHNQYNSYSSDDEASGSMNMLDTFPRNIPHQHQNFHPNQSRSTSNLNRSLDSEYAIWQDYYLSRAPSQQNIEMENRKMQWNDKLKLSAGDLLGRTHEELVLLLIQLRRRSTNICHAIETCYNEIESIQAQMHLMDAAKRLERLQKLEQIKQHLLALEKQYEKGKPMVNLVDNMVKLGSLYRFPNRNDQMNSFSTRDRIEFNQQIQEKKLLAEERRDWNRVNSNHLQLQEKVQQLYELDQMIQEGSGTLQGLQQDKEEIERALSGIRNRLMHGYNDPEVIEKAKKQQFILENELSRVHLMLAQNSKQLEETVAGNARLEQELLVLKQKLQVSKQSRSSPQFSNAGDSLTCTVGTSAMLESDLQKVQQKVGDLQRQRQELSMQVRQLTDRSNNFQQPIKAFSPTQQDGKRRIQSLWRETDLDTMNIIDHGDHWESNSSIPSIPSSVQSTLPPLYIKTDLKQGTEEEIYSSNEDAQQPTHQEKQEIKTVRIVKRESERRHRDREKVTPNKYDALVEDDIYYYNNSSPSRNLPSVQIQKAQSSTQLSYTDEDNLSRTSSTPSILQIDKEASPVLSPVFKSEAARQIITEMTQETPKNNRRAVPKEKRRHHTAPHNNLIMKSFNHLPTDDETFNKVMLETRRARDDLDMERALRQRIDAPDVVRSTLSNKELKYNENTIDNILGTPNKIFIPERYIPEQLPQLSAEEEEHRLRKVESIKKMLSDSTILSATSAGEEGESAASSNILNKSSNKMIEEKKQREHLLQLNQILAKQVMEMSKIVAGKHNADESI